MYRSGGNGSCRSWFFLRQKKKRCKVPHILTLPRQEVLKGRAGSPLLFKGENTEGQTAGTGSETLDVTEHSELAPAWPACSAQRARLVGAQGCMCPSFSTVPALPHRLTWRRLLPLQAFSQAQNSSEGLEARQIPDR